ncbi:MAG: ATP-binding protein [Nitriliruptorales bacterium]|nr:ATP-binding protein [Nitriliruptorales bacterium]
MILPPDTESPRRARRFVRDALLDDQVDTTLDVVTLLVSEVVTNAVLHARSDVTVRVRNDGRIVRVEVTDKSPAPPVQQYLSREATTGRGMVLVEALADAWGTNPGSDGKTVWFELDVAN